MKPKLSTWEFTDKEMMDTPSLKLGMSFKKEAEIRTRACRIIERVGKKLSIPLDQINMGKTLLHRFYMRHPLQKAEYHEVAAAIVFIASKLGNGKHFCKIEKVIFNCASDAKKGAYVDMKEDNKVVLELLCFDDYPDLPHPIALQVIRDFKGMSLFFLYSLQYINYTKEYIKLDALFKEYIKVDALLQIKEYIKLNPLFKEYIKVDALLQIKEYIKLNPLFKEYIKVDALLQI